jgi:hypothetical protein
MVSRESLYFLTALMVSYWATRAIGNPNQSSTALLVGILIPAAICLARAAFVKAPPRTVSVIRRGIFQVLMAAALICLLVCDVGAGLLLGFNTNSPLAWVVIGVLGVMYVLFFGLAQWAGFKSIQ